MADLLAPLCPNHRRGVNEPGSRIALELSEVATGVALVESFSNVVAVDGGAASCCSMPVCSRSASHRGACGVGPDPSTLVTPTVMSIMSAAPTFDRGRLLTAQRPAS
jgi:hypothetical protein